MALTALLIAKLTRQVRKANGDRCALGWVLDAVSCPPIDPDETLLVPRPEG